MSVPFFVEMKVSDTSIFTFKIRTHSFVKFKSVEDYSKPFGNCSSVASSSVAEDWADDAPPVAMLKT